MKLSRIILLPLLLILALLFAQQGAFAHGIAHALAELSQDHSLPHKHCDLCSVYAQIGSAVGVNHVHFDFALSFGATITTSPVSFLFIAFTAFAARAPPYSA